MPWTYNTIGYGGNKIGSLYGVLTYILEYRTATDEQREEIGKLKERYHSQRYVTPQDLKMVFDIIGATKELKMKRVKKKATKKARK
jgi:hypothetical protein